MGRGDARGWLTLLYEESCNPRWKDILTEMGLPAVFSPLHENDVNPDGTKKKAHRHLLLLWEGPTTYNNAKSVVDVIGGVGCLKAATVRGSIRYFAHLDNPEKYQYDWHDIGQIGGLDIESFIMSESDEDLILTEIYNFIESNLVDSYREFIQFCILERPEWLRLINRKYRENVWKYIRSMEYDLKRGKFDGGIEDGNDGSEESNKKIPGEERQDKSSS